MEDLFDRLSCAPLYESGKDFYSAPIPGLEIENLSKFYSLQLCIWQIRSNDLQKNFDLRLPDQRARFLAWCVLNGSKEYHALASLGDFWSELSLPAVIPQTQYSGAISRLQHLIAIAKTGDVASEALRTEERQLAITKWFWIQGGLIELMPFIRPILRWQKEYLLPSDKPVYESLFFQVLLSARPDLQQAFTKQGKLDRDGVVRWLYSYGSKETAVNYLIKEGRLAWPHSFKQASKEYPFGVNLVGYAYGELGIGEDLRMAAHALSAASIPFRIVNFDPGANVGQNDLSVNEWIGEPLYSINIFCLTALEHLRFYLQEGAAFFEGRYNIGYWPWELENWPKKWQHCFALVDEVWSSSGYTKAAIERKSPVQVLYMPMCVKVSSKSADREDIRKKYGIPQASYAFVFSFDGNSSIARKNPIAAVKAFLKAFSAQERQAVLIIKCMRGSMLSRAWEDIVKIASDDFRIIVVDAVISKDEVIQLYESCDCFVSLHRAEGYGRGIAEALLLGLNIIATGYSGNVEFCELGNASLVPYKLVPVKHHEYIEAEGCLWADPIIEEAAMAMRKLAAAHLRSSENANINNFFSEKSIGSRYKNRLEYIHFSNFHKIL